MRLITRLNRFISSGCLVFAAALIGCNGAAQSSFNAMPVQWTEEFGMAGLLQEEVAVDRQEDVVTLLEMPWYASIDVKAGGADGIKTLSSCSDYFLIQQLELHAKNEQERSALLELKVMCDATRLLSRATPAARSDIPARPLDAALPSKMPAAVALVTSQSEWERIRRESTSVLWGEVNGIRKVDQDTDHRSTYYSDAGMQVLAELGRGDIDGDGREDILVSVKDTAQGGDYFNLRLFVLTVTTEGQWKVVADH